MNTKEILEKIAAETGSRHLDSMLSALEDGEALASLGIRDEDQEAVECAHSAVVEMMANGHKVY